MWRRGGEEGQCLKKRAVEAVAGVSGGVDDYMTAEEDMPVRSGILGVVQLPSSQRSG